MLENKTNKCPFMIKGKCIVYNGRRYINENYHSECQNIEKDFVECPEYNEARTKIMDVVSGLPFTIKCGDRKIVLNKNNNK